jgi:hypothetical protein
MAKSAIRCLDKLEHFRHLVSAHDRTKHCGKAFRILDLVLHMVVAFKDREAAFWSGGHDGGTVLEVIFYAAEFPERMALELF